MKLPHRLSPNAAQVSVPPTKIERTPLNKRPELSPSVLCYELESTQVCSLLQTHAANGLAAADAADRFSRQGPNVLTGTQARNPLVMLIRQFTDFMILVLVAAAIIAGLIGDPQDSIAIVVIVFLNGLIGFVQEYRAERAMAALKQMAPQVRGGQRHVVDSRTLVPGDLVELEAGNVVPADLRLVRLASLKLSEAALHWRVPAGG